MPGGTIRVLGRGYEDSLVIFDIHGNILSLIIINHSFSSYSHGLIFTELEKITLYIYIYI